MTIYGTALLSGCLLIGLLAGKLLALAFGVDGNIGGVGFAMLLLIIASDRIRRHGLLGMPGENGIVFWSSIYLPVVVAMAASQDVVSAIGGSAIAVVAGLVSVVTCYALFPLIFRLTEEA